MSIRQFALRAARLLDHAALSLRLWAVKGGPDFQALHECGDPRCPKNGAFTCGVCDGCGTPPMICECCGESTQRGPESPIPRFDS